jgi:putative transposase
MDLEFTQHCFHGVIGMRDVLRLHHGYWVNEKRIRRLMHIMGLEAVAPKPDLSKPGKGHKIYPYLLRGVAIDGPDHMWSTDITYIAMGKELTVGPQVITTGRIKSSTPVMSGRTSGKPTKTDYD